MQHKGVTQPICNLRHHFHYISFPWLMQSFRRIMCIGALSVVPQPIENGILTVLQTKELAEGHVVPRGGIYSSP